MSNPGFGDLTIKVKLVDGSYKEVKIADSGADANVNGKIDTQAEFDTLVDYIESKYGQGVADSFNFQSLASLKTNDGEIDADELQIWPLVEQINDAYNAKLAFLAGDTFFSGNAGLMYQMRDHLEEFKNNYINTIQPETLATDLDNAVVRFGEAIDAEYDNFKAELQKGVWITNGVKHVMDMVAFASLSQQEYNSVYNKIAEEARRYLDENPNATDQDLDWYLDQWLEQDLLRGYAENNDDLVNWNSALATCQTDDYIDLVSELPTLKSIAKSLINRAYDCDITFVKNGHEITKETLIAQINGYNSEADAEKLVNLMTFINEAIDSAYRNGSSRAQLLAQGADKIRIDITTAEVLPNQTLDESTRKTIINATVDEILSNYDDFSFTQELGDLLYAKANKFNYEGNKPDEFKEKLLDYLNAYIAGPIAGIYEELEAFEQGHKPKDFNLSGHVSNEEFNFLKDMFKYIITTAGKYNIVIVDANGSAITGSNVNTFLNGFAQNPADASRLLEYINKIKSELETFNKNLLELLENNAGNGLSIKISIDGTIIENSIGELDPEGAMAAIEDVIDAVIGQNCLSNVSAETKQKIHDRLELFANKFLEGYHGTNLEQFRLDLSRALEDYFENPLCDIKNAADDISTAVNNITVEGSCSDKELKKLKDQFNNLLAAMGSDIILCDANGKALTINLDAYGITNAKALKDLILSITTLIKNCNSSLVGLFQLNEDGVLKIYIVNGKAQLAKPDVTNPTIPSNAPFGPYDRDTIYQFIKNKANEWGMTIYDDLFQQAFGTAIKNLTTVGDLIYCEPNKLAKKVKEEYAKLFDENNGGLSEQELDNMCEAINEDYPPGEGWWKKWTLKHIYLSDASSFYSKLKNKAQQACEAKNIPWTSGTTTNGTPMPSAAQGKFWEIFKNKRDTILDALPSNGSRVQCDPDQIARQIAIEVNNAYNLYLQGQNQ